MSIDRKGTFVVVPVSAMVLHAGSRSIESLGRLHMAGNVECIHPCLCEDPAATVVRKSEAAPVKAQLKCSFPATQAINDANARRSYGPTSEVVETFESTTPTIRQCGKSRTHLEGAQDYLIEQRRSALRTAK